MNDKAYEGGYIKIFRKMTEWEWFKDSITVHVFLYLLMSANWQDNRVSGLTIKRGQLLTTQSRIAETLGISRQNVRTALNHLKLTNEITIELTNGLTNRTMLVTIENYEKYQADDEQPTNGLTNEVTNELTHAQPMLNQCLTTNEEREEREEINNILNIQECNKNEIPKNGKSAERKQRSRAPFTPPTIDEVRAYCNERHNQIDAEQFIDYYGQQGWKLSNGNKMTDWKASVRTWERNKNNGRKKGGYATNQQMNYMELEAYIANGGN